MSIEENKGDSDLLAGLLDVANKSVATLTEAEAELDAIDESLEQELQRLQREYLWNNPACWTQL